MLDLTAPWHQPQYVYILSTGATGDTVYLQVALPRPILVHNILQRYDQVKVQGTISLSSGLLCHEIETALDASRLGTMWVEQIRRDAHMWAKTYVDPNSSTFGVRTSHVVGPSYCRGPKT